LERGADLIPFELVVLVAPHRQRRPVRIECARQPLAAGAQAQGVAPRSELYIPFFNDRNAVFRVVVAVAAAEIASLSRPRHPEIAEAVPRLRVVQLAFRRLDVSRVPAAAAG